MMKFFKKPSDWILGCDPGPEHSAFALLDCRGVPKVAALSYVPNRAIGLFPPENFRDALEWDDESDFSPVGPGAGSLTYAFERCSVQAGGANAMVFETCMVAGELRYILGRNPSVRMFSFSPGEWRYVLTGKACAKDTNIRNLLLTALPDCDILCHKYSTKAKKMFGLKKPITSHLRDAMGVAVSCGLVGFRQGLELAEFPARLEVHCG